jgi:hypothetical protein
MSNNLQMQSTPNPNARKFVLPEKRFAPSQNFASTEAATTHPLAARLFALGGVYNVLLAQDFVTVNKFSNVTWEEIEEQIKTAIIDYLRDVAIS